MSEQSAEAQFALQRIYIKDFSFESPKSPDSFRQQWKPQVNLELNTTNNNLGEDNYEVLLSLTVTTKNEREETIYLVEEYLFFKQYNFHKQKLAFHRSSIKFYADFLKNKGVEVVYIEANDERADIRKLLVSLSDDGITAF